MTKGFSSLNRENYRKAISTVVCVILCFIMLFLGKEIKLGALEGIRLSSQMLIPTLFPFFVLSDYWSKNFHIREESLTAKVFEKLFHMTPSGMIAFITGIVCGFPLGVKVACDLYHQEKINEDQLTHLCGFSNNPSIAFTICGVGLGIFGSAHIGIMLFFSCTASAVLCGVIFRQKERKQSFYTNISRQRFDLVESIKIAGLTSITISSFVIFFSSLIYALKSLPNSIYIIVLLELCTAVKTISESNFNHLIKIILTAFSLGFSGFSVHLQAFSFMPSAVNKIRYLIMKFVQGILSSAIAYFLLIVMKVAI